jgi:hypothetical protein
MEKGSIAEFLAGAAAFGTLAIGLITIPQSQNAEHDAGEALKIARQQAYSQARAEISGYVVDMARLDREAGIRNGNQVLVLAQQSQALIDTYGEERLALSATTYRLIGQFVSLTGENTALAKDMLTPAVRLAGPEGRPADPLELVRSYRVYGDIAAQDGQADKMATYYRKALTVAGRVKRSAPEYFDLKDSLSYTRVYVLFSALLLAQESQGENKACQLARRYLAETLEHGDLRAPARRESLETARRAVRLDTVRCGLGINMTPWYDIWWNRLNR